MLKDIVKNVAAQFGYRISRINPVIASNQPSYTDLKVPQPYMGEEFIQIWRKWCEVTGWDAFSTSFYTSYRATKYIVMNNVPGDFVESGVYQGNQCVIVALTLQHLGDTGRKIYMYDTYEGMPEPGANDFDLNKGGSTKEKWETLRKDGVSEWNNAPYELVQTNMLKTGYDESKIIMVKGKVQDTLPKTKPKRAAFLRLDTDFYESTQAEMSILYPRLAPNGVLIVDGYGRWMGQKKAVDEYFAKEKIEPLLLRVGYNDWVSVRV